jgi:hypothetical protein
MAVRTGNDGAAPPAPGTLPGSAESPFDVPSFLHALGGLVHRHPDFWLWLGRLETSLLAAELGRVLLQMPLWVSGLARSGSTLLHEVIASHPSVATHRIKDYPLVFTPYWWRRATANLRPGPPRQRPHQDGVLITTDSPDALEEMVWMAFFPRCHDPAVCNLVGAEVRHRPFESFFTAHIRKLLLAERATRYAAKANYHLSRLPYLVRLFPDAKFLIPVRAPASHIASLIRQQRIFSAGQRKHPRALAFMQRSGHFEFGLDRRPMHLGDGERIQEIKRAWSAGEEVRGLALYWNMVYGYVARLLATDPRVGSAALVVRFEALCDAPVATLRAILEHAQLDNVAGIIDRYARGIRLPTSSVSQLSAGDLDVIRSETRSTAALWGYC